MSHLPKCTIYLVFLVLVFTAKSQVYKAVYKYTPYYDLKKADDAVYNLLKRSLFENLIFESYANDSFNFVVANLNQNLKEGHTNDSKVSGNFINESGNSIFIDYLKNVVIEITDGDQTKCNLMETPAFMETGRTKMVFNYLCLEWKPIDKKYDKIRVWTSKHISKGVNPGLFIPEAKAGIVFLDIKNEGCYSLIKYTKELFDKKRYFCNQTPIKRYNFAALLVQDVWRGANK